MTNYAVIVSPETIDFGPIPFDLYATNHRNYIVLFCRAGFHLTARHEKVLRGGSRHFYISHRDLDHYFDYIAQRIERILENPRITSVEKVRLLQGVERRIVRQLLVDPCSRLVVEQAKRIIRCHVELVLRRPELATELFAPASDIYALAHSINVCTLCIMIGERVHGRAGEELWQLGMAGLLHDLGKTRVERSIIYKPGPLTEEELLQVRRYPLYSHAIASVHDLPQMILESVRSHQERIDGSGYPDNLRGEQIHPHARIVAVSDVFDAITSDRVYRRGLPVLQGLVEIIGSSDRFDADALEALLRVVLRNDTLVERFRKSLARRSAMQAETQSAEPEEKSYYRGFRVISGGRSSKQ